MLLRNKKVAIIGAGPVGLTMARLLQQKGVSVAVYERDKNAQTRISGGTLDLHPGSGQDALKEAGLLEKYYALAKPMGRTITDQQGTVIFTKNALPEERYDNPEINRNDLRQLLLDGLAHDTVIWDRKFIGLEAVNGMWLLQFEDAPDVTADLVIGANGGMSKARKYVTNAEIEYTGTMIIQGEVFQPQTTCAAFYKLCGGNILMAASNGNLLVANPDNNGLLTYNIIFRTTENWNDKALPDFKEKDSVIAYLLTKLSDWSSTYKQLIRSTTSFVPWPTRRIPLDISWKKDRPLLITLIGDAAHIMPPFAGQGVNTGLKDALILSSNLTAENFESMEAAITDYEQKMLGYAAAAQSETSKNESTMLQPTFTFESFYY